MKQKTYFSIKPSMRKLIAIAALGSTLLCGFQTRSVLAESLDTSSTAAPVVTHESVATTENSQSPSSATPTANQTPAAPTNNTAPTAPSAPSAPTSPTSGWRQENGQFHYYNEDGVLATNQWIKDDSGWHYVDAAGNTIKGWYTTPNGKTWYFNQIGRAHV